MVIKVTIVKVLEPFLSKPFEKLHLADISRVINLPHPTVRQHLSTLEQQGILIKEIKGRLTLYSLNFSNPLIFHYLSMSECNRIITVSDTNLIFNEIISFFNKNAKNTDAIIIFGSVVTDFKTANDIDILVVGDMGYNSDIDQLAIKLNTQL